MELNNTNIIDMEYAATRFTTPLDRKTINELKDKNIITSYRDIVTAKDVLADASNNEEISELSRDKLKKVIESEEIIKRTKEEYVRRASELGISVISREDELYPWAWRQLSGMPDVFFARGDLSILDKCYQNGVVSIVGSRNPSLYAQQVTRSFTEALAEKGIVTCSGMAVGIDRTVHAATLNKKKPSIGILPCGVDVVYPARNEDVYKRLCDIGLVLSELPPGQEVIKQYFPARNRLIAGLSDVTLVMEAGEYSGTLHTASYAANQGKDVMVLPNTIYETNNYGGLCLIRDGAEVLIDVDTVIEKVAQNLYYRIGKVPEATGIQELRERSATDPASLGDEEWKCVILDNLSAKSMALDEITVYCPIPIEKLGALMSELETANKVEVREGKYVLTFKGL